MKESIFTKIKYHIKSPTIQEYHNTIDHMGHEWSFLPSMRDPSEIPIDYDVYLIDRYGIVRVGNEIKYFNISKFKILKDYGKYAFDNITTLSMLIGGTNWYREIKNRTINPNEIPDTILIMAEPILENIMVELL